jgi:hypothetical protein
VIMVVPGGDTESHRVHLIQSRSQYTAPASQAHPNSHAVVSCSISRCNVASIYPANPDSVDFMMHKSWMPASRGFEDTVSDLSHQSAGSGPSTPQGEAV